MPVIRIYQNIALQESDSIQLNDRAAHHILHVFRLSKNDPLILFNGQGGEFSAAISEYDKKNVQVDIKKFHALERESPLKIHLAQSISRGEKMDFTIQKAVELSIHTIIPIISERCGVKLSSEHWQKRMLHWQNIIISACEQCGRNTLYQH